MGSGFLFFSVSLFCIVTHGNGLTLLAKVSLNGVRGTVTFVQDGGITTVTFNINGLQNSNSWQIRQNRMIYDRENRCSDDVLGNTYIPASGTVTTSGTLTAQITTQDLPNLSSLTGRSILLTDSNTTERVCSTIEEDTDHITAVAKLQHYVGGTIFFRQKKSSSSSATAIYTNAFQLQNGGDEVKWEIYSGMMANPTSCSGIGNLFNPTGKSAGGSCASNSQIECPVGDMTSKHTNLTVGATSEATLTSFVDLNLPLSGSNSVIGKILVLKAMNGSILTCANIVQYTTRNARALFSRHEVTGEISFQQMSPLDVTKVSVEIYGLNASAGGYHVHDWPVPEKWTHGQMVCSSEYVSGHFTPLLFFSPTSGSGTDDQYEIGDLSGKYGMLTGLTEKNATYTDYNLPLFGVNSILGRSIVIHYNNGGRWVCSNIEYDGTTITGVATFVYPVIGTMVFKQPSDIDEAIAETMIYTSLNYATVDATRTINHKWHVHVSPIGSDMLNHQGRCASAQGHYNPYVVDLSGNYSSDCKRTNQLRCEVGDLSGKHGRLSIQAMNSAKAARNYFTDIDLPLNGSIVNILRRSVVIHAANGGNDKISCANIHFLPKRKVKVMSWQKQAAGTVSGYYSMEQSTDGLTFGTTNVNISLDGLAALAGGYHVHVYPVPPLSASPCLSASVGGHYNPFDIDPYAGPADGTGSDDEYEIGDLSRKYGEMLDSKSSFSAMDIKDTMLPLRGPLSIVGRSIVIHKSSTGGPRWVCGNITEDTSSTGGDLYEAMALFDEGPITGYIYLTQYMYEDGGLSDTGVLVDLKYKDSSMAPTEKHNWHVHQGPVKGDYNACQTPGGHYNPFRVAYDSKYDAECSPSNPLRCELGDQSKKLGQYNIGTGRKFSTDVNLPLVGMYGVAGKSFVVHTKNGTGSRLACADIIPVNKVDPLVLNFETHSFDKTSMVNTLASALHTYPTNLAVMPSKHSASSCMSASVHFTGREAATLRSNLYNMVSNRDSKLGSYIETPTCCSCTSVISLICLLLGLLVQRLMAYS